MARNVQFGVRGIPQNPQATGGADHVLICDGTTGQNHLYQSWWWYRINGEPREFAFNSSNAQLRQVYAGDNAQLTWANVDAKNFAAQLDLIAYATGANSGCRCAGDDDHQQHRRTHVVECVRLL